MPGGQRKKKGKRQSDNASVTMPKKVCQDLDESSCSESEPDPCADCGSEIFSDDLALQCDLCDHWFCNANCLKLNRAAYDRIGKSKESEGIMWFCKHCRISFPGTAKILGRMSSMEKRQSTLESRISALEKKGSMQNTVAENRNDNEREQSSVNVSDIVSEVLSEQHERDLRKLNVVCFGLKESIEQSVEARKDDDSSKIDKVLHEVMNLPSVKIADPIRLGRFEEGSARIRPIRFTVESMVVKQQIIERSRSHVKSSKEEICKDLFFQSDLTAKQREDEYKKRVQRRKQNALLNSRSSSSQGLPSRTFNRSRDTGAASSSADRFRE